MNQTLPNRKHNPLCIAIATVCCMMGMGFAYGEPVELDSGERLDVTSATIDGGNVILQHPILGTLTVPIDKVRSINGAPPVKPPPTAAASDPTNAKSTKTATSTPKAAEHGNIVEPEPSEWKGTFTLSGSFNEGTSQNASLFTKVQLTRDTDQEQTKISSFYRFASDSNSTSQSWYNITANQLWNLADSDWGIFADGSLDWSEFNSWQQRIAGHAGVQIPLLDLKKQQHPTLWFESIKMHGRIGAGPRKEFAGTDTGLVLEGDIGGSLTMDIVEGNSIEANASYYPSLTTLGVYRADADLNWKMKLKGLDNLSLSVGLTFQYQNKVSSNDKNYDLLGTVGVAFDF